MTKKSSVNVPDKAYKPNPKFTIAILKDKGFGELLEWLKQISRFSRVQDFLYISDYKDKTLRLKIFTKDHSYSVSARLPEGSVREIVKDENGHITGESNMPSGGYLGCISQTRKPRAGEDWNRGRDLADGKYNEKTWQEIKDDILAYELVKVVRNSSDKEKEGRAIEAVVDEKDLFPMLKHNLIQLKTSDELGFNWKNQHYIIRKGEFSS